MITLNVRYFASDKNNKGLNYSGFLNTNETRPKEVLKAEIDSKVTGADYELTEVIDISGEGEKISY